LWYTVLPSLVYAALGVTALLTTSGALPLFFIAAGALGLLLIGIHNACDTVTFIVVSTAVAAVGRIPAYPERVDLPERNRAGAAVSGTLLRSSLELTCSLRCRLEA
jgi:hypothetical protein